MALVTQLPIAPGRISGFTLLELMITVAVMAVLLGLAMPSMRDFILASQTTSQFNNMMGNLNMARAEAAKSGNSVRVSAVDGDWNSGWQIATDRNRNAAIDADQGDLQLMLANGANRDFNWQVQAGGANTLVFYFEPSGRLAGNQALTLELRRPDNAEHPERCKRILVDPSGRAEGQKGLVQPCV